VGTLRAPADLDDQPRYQLKIYYYYPLPQYSDLSNSTK